RCDDVPGARLVVVEIPENVLARGGETDLLAELAERRGDRVLAGIDAAAGQRPLPRVRPQLRGATGEQEARGTVGVGDGCHGDGGGAAVLNRNREPLVALEIRGDAGAELGIEG